jgi:hypothetical protein
LDGCKSRQSGFLESEADVAGALKTSKVVVKHRSAPKRAQVAPAADLHVRNATFAIMHLENAIDEIYARMMQADGDDFTRLANTLTHAITALFNGHRTLSYLTGGATPMDDALKELKSLDFAED